MATENDIAPSERIRFERFPENDAQALTGLLADPDIARNVMANGSTGTIASGSHTVSVCGR